MITAPTLPDHLFAAADRGTSHYDRTDARRREYGSAMRVLAAVPHVTQDDVDRYSRAWAAYLAARGRCVSTLVAGRSNFPTRKARKASASADKRWQEVAELRRLIERQARKRAKAAEVDAAGGQDELDRIDLDLWRRKLATMKAANRIVRSKPRNARTDEKVRKLVALDGMTAERSENLFVAEFGYCGFTPSTLTSARGKIKRLEEKLARADKAASTPTLDDVELRVEAAGATVVMAHEDDRLRIEYDRKPGLATRQALKGNGFRRSRTSGAWQRKLTAGGTVSWPAVYAAGVVLGVVLRVGVGGLVEVDPGREKGAS